MRWSLLGISRKPTSARAASTSDGTVTEEEIALVIGDSQREWTRSKAEQLLRRLRRRKQF